MNGFLVFTKTVDDLCKSLGQPKISVELNVNFSLTCDEINILKEMQKNGSKTRSDNDSIENLLNLGLLIRNPSCNGTYYTISPLAKNLNL